MAAPPQAAASLDDCLTLLRGPLDERRVAGLLLVMPYLVPTEGFQEDNAVAQAVADALGLKFINRLLLPLRQSQDALPTRPEAENTGKEAVSAILGIQILAHLSCLPNVVNSTLMAQYMPHLLQVARAGGVYTFLAGSSPQQIQLVLADKESVHDVLVCLVAYASSEPQHAAAMSDAGALTVASHVLQASAKDESEIAMLALRLLALMLPYCTPESLRLSDEALQLPGLLSALGVRFGVHPSIRQNGAASSYGSAELQLQAMHVLLRLLPLLSKPMLGDLASPMSDWLNGVRRGVGAVLQSRSGVRERHGALLLASFAMQLAGESWLLPAKVIEEEAHFYQLLVQVVSVELSLLLHDATQPHNLVPSSASDSAVPRPARREQGAELASSDMQGVTQAEVQEVGIGSFAEGQGNGSEGHQQGDASQPFRVTAEDVDAAARRWEENVGSAKAPTAEGMEPAGARAARMLPAVFSILEGCAETLAADARATEGPDAMEVDEDIELSKLEYRAALQASDSLFNSMEMVMQLLEVASTGGPPSADDPILLAAVRVLGRYMKDLPKPLNERLRALLPFLVTIQGGQALRFLLPFLLLACGTDGDAVGLNCRAWLKAFAAPEVMAGVGAYGVACLQTATTTWQAGADVEAMLAAEECLQGFCSFFSGVLSAGSALVGLPALRMLQGLLHGLDTWSEAAPSGSRLSAPPALHSASDVGSRVVVVCALVAALIKQQMFRLCGMLEGEWETQASHLLIAGVERGWSVCQITTQLKQAAAARRSSLPPSDIPEYSIPGMANIVEDDPAQALALEKVCDMWLDLLHVLTPMVRISCSLQQALQPATFPESMQRHPPMLGEDDLQTFRKFLQAVEGYAGLQAQ